MSPFEGKRRSIRAIEYDRETGHRAVGWTERAEGWNAEQARVKREA
jgi:hypothetical protein